MRAPGGDIDTRWTNSTLLASDPDGLQHRVVLDGLAVVRLHGHPLAATDRVDLLDVERELRDRARTDGDHQPRPGSAACAAVDRVVLGLGLRRELVVLGVALLRALEQLLSAP